MADITLGGNPFKTSGELPATGSKAPDFTLVKGDLSTVSLADFKGSNLILNIFPSVDTGTCAASVRKFNERAWILRRVHFNQSYAALLVVLVFRIPLVIPV